jgi:hypothetical protein
MTAQVQDEVPDFWRTLSNGRGVYLKRPVSAVDLEQLQEYARIALGQTLPQDYVSFLNQSDGLQVENALFMAASDVAPTNLDSPIDFRIRVGSAGNLDDFFFDVRIRKFVIAPMGHPDETHSLHDTFWDLLKCVLKEQGALSNA